jgi:hypothetical protein
MGKPSDHFKVLTYTGTGSLSVTGVGFQPNLVWCKSRNSTYNHQVHDSVRGATAGMLSTNSFSVEDNTYHFDSFDADGFTTDSNNIFGVCNTNDPMVSWFWKAGGTSVTNTAGSITSQVSANQVAGFSIVSYTGTGANATVGHGLGAIPEMMLVKARTLGSYWRLYHKNGYGSGATNPQNGSADFDIGGPYSDNNAWNSTAPTSSVFSLGANAGSNYSGGGMIAYCWKSVPGYSRFGFYTGNGAADGPFVNLGFRPAWILIKRSNATWNWFVFDSKRIGYNPINYHFHSDTNAAEGTDSLIDITANGFKLRTTDAGLNYGSSTPTYIYAAFAEMPAKYSRAH